MKKMVSNFLISYFITDSRCSRNQNNPNPCSSIDMDSSQKVHKKYCSLIDYSQNGIGPSCVQFLCKTVWNWGKKRVLEVTYLIEKLIYWEPLLKVSNTLLMWKLNMSIMLKNSFSIFIFEVIIYVIHYILYTSTPV